MTQHSPHARAGALACAAGLLLAALCGGCRTVPSGSIPRKREALQWVIVDPHPGANRGELTGTAVTAVLGSLAERPVITYYTGDQDIRVSRMLAEDTLPDLLTVPARGALRSKLIGSGRVWRIRELSPAVYDAIPADVRAAYAGAGELYAVPGAYTAEGYVPVAREGVFVRAEYASLLGDPVMDTADAFAWALEAFVRMAADNQLIAADELVPVVFGQELEGLATVEHLCGVPPFYHEGASSYHRIFSPAIDTALAFFDRLDALSVYRIFEAYTADRLTELLKNNAFAYIGGRAFIEEFNLENPRNRYVEVTPPFAVDGYLEAYSRYGAYETFVSRDCRKGEAAALLEALASPQASRTFLYGVEDVDWVMVNGAVTPLKTTVERLRTDTRAFLHQTGIGAFPFLSRDGLLPPYQQGKSTRARDITRETVYFSPADYHGYYVSQMDERLRSYYIEVANASVGAGDIAARIQVLGAEKEPLAVSR